MDPVVLQKHKKGRALKKCSFGCLSGFHAINVSNGCMHYCVYCYARGYSSAPAKGVVELYSNLPELIKKELSSPRKRRMPEFVIFNTASDCFQPHPDIWKITYGCMEELLKRGIHISFLTKGYIPDPFIALFSKRKRLVRAQIGLVSLDNSYASRFEPFAPSPERRLENIERLCRIGIIPDVRMDPIIPFLTDTEDHVKKLLSTLKRLGVKKVTLSYLHIRPSILDNLRKELNPGIMKLLDACYYNRPWQEVGTSTMSKLLPLELRKRGYNRIKRIAGSLGIEATVCHCKNPDMKASICVSYRKKEEHIEQLSLFHTTPAQRD